MFVVVRCCLLVFGGGVLLRLDCCMYFVVASVVCCCMCSLYIAGCCSLLWALLFRCSLVVARCWLSLLFGLRCLWLFVVRLCCSSCAIVRGVNSVLCVVVCCLFLGVVGCSLLPAVSYRAWLWLCFVVNWCCLLFGVCGSLLVLFGVVRCSSLVAVCCMSLFVGVR